MAIRFAPNKNNNEKVVEEQAVDEASAVSAQICSPQNAYRGPSNGD